MNNASKDYSNVDFNFALGKRSPICAEQLRTQYKRIRQAKKLLKNGRTDLLFYRSRLDSTSRGVLGPSLSAHHLLVKNAYKSEYKGEFLDRRIECRLKEFRFEHAEDRTSPIFLPIR